MDIRFSCTHCDQHIAAPPSAVVYIDQMIDMANQ